MLANRRNAKLEKQKIIALNAAILACIIIDGFATYVVGKETVYTHFFYIPLILAGLWYYRKAVYTAIFLGALHILSVSFFLGFDALTFLECTQRAVMFIVVAYVIGFVSEKRAKAEEEVTTERDRSQQILGTIGETVYIFDRDLTITEVNRPHLKTFDINRAEVIGKKCYELFFGRKERCPDCLINDVFKNGVCVRVEQMIPLSGDVKKYFDVMYCPLIDIEGNVTEVICDVRDLTERKEMEEKLARSERLATIGQFSAGMAHELRQPLGVINNSVYFITNKLKDIAQEKVKKHLAILEKEVKHANSLISDLLDFARLDVPDFKDCNVNQVIEEVLYSAKIAPNISVKTELEETLPLIRCDYYQIQRVCSNLISNAVSAMPEGGTLEIMTDEDKYGGFIEVCIADTGEGIQKEFIQKAFEPFFTTKARGIGLGLSLCKKYVKAHSGTIDVESETGKGTSFTVKLPLNPVLVKKEALAEGTGTWNVKLNQKEGAKKRG
jgi:PAS domain S-box-containing protein